MVELHPIVDVLVGLPLVFLLAMDIRASEGLVVLLDSLGTSGFSLSECAPFLTDRKVFLDEFVRKLHEMRGHTGTQDVHTFTFGDTILVAIEHPLDDSLIADLGRLIAYGAYWCVPFGLHRRLRWRGAFSLGQFVVDAGSNTVLGPAVADAASWYDKADWIGMTATPQCGHYLGIAAAQMRDAPYAVQYEVPLAAGGTRKLWALPWPDSLKKRETVLYWFTQFAVPKGTEMKYQNTLDFADYCFSTQESRLSSARYFVPRWKT